MGRDVSKFADWRQGEDEFSIYIEDSDGHIIADVREPEENGYLPVEERMELHRKRARLLAASDKLFGWAQILEDYLDGVLETNEAQTEAWLEELRSDIAEIEGSTP